MTLAPGYRMDNGKMVKVRANRSAHVAVTQYQVLSSTPSSALVELQPITGEDAPFHCEVTVLLCPGPWPGFSPYSEPLMLRIGCGYS